MREHPSTARQYKLPPQALWRPTLIYHHQDPQHKPASLSRAATSSASSSAHSPRSYLASSPPELPEKGDTVQSLGKADADFSVPSQLPVHKRTPAGTQSLVLECVAGTPVPFGGMAVMPELCRVLAGNGSGAGMCWGRGRKVALGNQDNDEVAVKIGVPPLLPPLPLLPLTKPALHLLITQCFSLLPPYRETATQEARKNVSLLMLSKSLLCCF